MLRDGHVNPGKPLTDGTLRSLGIEPYQPQKVRRLEELNNYPPNVAIAEAIRSIRFKQDEKGELNSIKKKNKYVVPISLYKQLHYDTRNDVKILRPARPKFKDMYRPYNGQDITNKTILFWRTGGIGDLLFIQPNLRYLKETYPSCKIMFACAARYQPMVRNWDCVDEVLGLPFPVPKLGEAHYHAIFEGVIERTIESHYKNAYKLFTKWLNINLEPDKLIPYQEPNYEIVKELEPVLKNNHGIEYKNFIVAQIHASSPVRSPSYTSISKVINELTSRGEKVVIMDSPSNSKYVDYFIDNYINNKENVINGGNYSKSLIHMISITHMAKGALSVDSSLIHVAASLNVPMFGIYGPFAGYTRLNTYKNVDWIDCGYDELECAPCNKHGGEPCANGKSVCFDVTLNKEGKEKEIVDRFEKLYKEH